MNIRQKQAVYLCPKCHGEDQSFTSGLGSYWCSMYCHTCGFSVGSVIPGDTAYGPLNPRVKITTGRYAYQAPTPLPLPDPDLPLPIPKYDAMQEVIIEKKIIEDFVAMDKITLPETSRWDEII